MSEIITSQAQINEKLAAYRKELEQTITVESLKKTYPKVIKLVKSEDFETYDTREIPIVDLEKYIEIAKANGASALKFYSRVYDGDFEGQEVSYEVNREETDEEYTERLKARVNASIDEEVKKKKVSLTNQLSKYESYLELKKELEK